jgi:K+ transporter
MRKLWNNHPNLVSWALLAVGMVIIVVFSARNVGFQPGQWAAIIVATILLAGLCVWIVSWEDSGEPSADEALSSGKEQDAAPQQSARSGDV